MFIIFSLLSIFVPILSGILIKYLKAGRKSVCLVSLLSLTAASLFSVTSVLCCSKTTFTLWRIAGKVAIAFTVDGMSAFYILLISLVWVGVGIYAVEYTEHDDNYIHFFRYYLITYGTLIGLSLSENLVTFYMFYEMMTLVTVPLVAHNRDQSAISASVKYLIYSTFGASVALLGIFFIGVYAEGFSFRAGGIFNEDVLKEHGDLLRVIFFLMILGFGVKAGMFPMHAWLPTAHPVAPAPASAVLSGVITKMGVLGIIRTIFFIAGAEMLRGSWVQYTFMILTLITVVMGSMLAYKEKVLKKRLAYSTVSQISYVLFGLSTMTEAGFVGACLHILFHSLIKNTLFMSAGAVIHKTGLTQVNDLRSIGKRMPKTMTLFTLVSLGLIGIPPTGGFISKWNLAQGALTSGISRSWVGVVCLLLSAVLTAAYLLSISISAFFSTDIPCEGCDCGLRMLIPMTVFTLLIISLGILPGGLISYFTSIAAGIL